MSLASLTGLTCTNDVEGDFSGEIEGVALEEATTSLNFSSFLSVSVFGSEDDLLFTFSDKLGGIDSISVEVAVIGEPLDDSE